MKSYLKSDTIQGPLKQIDGIALNGPDIRNDGMKPCKWLKFMGKIFEKYFQMNNSKEIQICNT